MRWLWAFLFTQAVEVPIWTAALSFRSRIPRALWQRLALAFAASLLTHPVVWFVIPALYRSSYWGMVAVAEAFAVVTEAGFMFLLGLREPLGWSLAANAASLGLGLLSRFAFGWP